MRIIWIFLFFCVLCKQSASPAKKDKLRVEELEVVLGSMAKLPCDLVPPEDGDSVALVIWYKDEDKTPIYSLDVRDRDLQKGIHWADGDLEGRAQFSSDLYQAALTLDNSKGSDSGLYKCRVDFKHSPTRNSLVNVSVIVPPEDIHLEDADGILITSRNLGPLSEGEPLKISCICAGGVPPPRLSWWYNLTLLDDSYEILEDGRIKNTLLMQKLEREHLYGILTCQAHNSPFVVPKSTSVSIDLYMAPLDVRLLGDNLAMSASSEYELACQTSGSKPPATLTWWKSGVPLHIPAREVSSIEGNVTTSTIRLRPTKADHGTKLSCRATNPRVPNKALEASWTLNVNYVPEAQVVVSSEDNNSKVREGMSVIMECRVKSNPPVTSVRWKRNGEYLQSEIDYQVFANNSLGLLFVTRKDSGEYVCETENSEGRSQSESLLLDVKYIPKCNTDEETLHGASLGEEVNVSCETTGNPPATHFRWSFNNASLAQGHSTNGSNGVSFTRVALSTDSTDVTLFCWAENEVGNQTLPCSFRVALARAPDPVSNCSVLERGDTWVSLMCLGASDGGLPQTFVAAISLDGHLVANASRMSFPQFTLSGLEPGSTYVVGVRATNAKGSSEVVTLQASTTGKLLTQRRITSSAEASTQAVDSSLLLAVMSFLSCILAISLLLGVILGWRKLHRKPQESKPSPELAKAEQVITSETCNGSDDDRNPDVVPCGNEMTVMEVKAEDVLEDPGLWQTQLVVNTIPVHLVNTQTVPCMQGWGVVGWEGSCPNIVQRTVETQTPQNVLESVV